MKNMGETRGEKKQNEFSVDAVLPTVFRPLLAPLFETNVSGKAKEVENQETKKKDRWQILT